MTSPIVSLLDEESLLNEEALLSEASTDELLSSTAALSLDAAAAAAADLTPAAEESPPARSYIKLSRTPLAVTFSQNKVWFDEAAAMLHLMRRGEFRSVLIENGTEVHRFRYGMVIACKQANTLHDM